MEQEQEVSRATHCARARKFLKEACEVCGVKGKLDAHHKDRNWRNDDSTNIQTLCRKCHNEEHYTAGDYGDAFKTHLDGAMCQYCDSKARRLAEKIPVCHLHYLRIKRTGTPQLIYRPTNADKKCAEQNCDQPVYKKRLCSAHYQRVKRHGTTEKLPTRSKPFEKCHICGEDATIKGMCNKHYLRWRRHGDPLAGGRERSSREGRMCPVCNEPALKWPVYCNKHHLRWKRYGDPLGSAKDKAKKDLDAQE